MQKKQTAPQKKMDLQDLFEKHLQKIDVLNDFIVLYGKKTETVSDLREIANECDEIKELMRSCKDLLNKFQTENLAKCRAIVEKSQQQQLIMLDILDQVVDRNEPKMFENTTENDGCASPMCQNRPITVLSEISNTMTPSKFTPFKPGDQPVMTYADYIKSPYATKRMRPLALQFTDFERTITADEFAKIPGYEMLHPVVHTPQISFDVELIWTFLLLFCFTVGT